MLGVYTLHALGGIVLWKHPAARNLPQRGTLSAANEGWAALHEAWQEDVRGTAFITTASGLASGALEASSSEGFAAASL